jgi:hypothetical protein
MDTIKLQFQTPQDLQKFRLFASPSVTEWNIQNLTVTCQCSLKQIAEARTKFGALIIDPKK